MMRRFSFRGRSVSGRIFARAGGLAALALLALAGCDRSGGATDVGGVTPDEARGLNEAAAMLDERAANTQAAMAPAPTERR